MRRPVPLLPDATNGITAYNALNLAASTMRPTEARLLRRYARQLKDAATAAQARASYIGIPKPNTNAPQENTLHEIIL